MRGSRFLLGATIVALGVAGAFYGYQRVATQPVHAQNAPPPAAAIAVPVVPVKKEDVPVYLDYVATTEPIRMVNLQAKVTGYLLRRGAPDGADVKQGDLLYKIDPRDFRPRSIRRRRRCRRIRRRSHIREPRKTAAPPSCSRVTPAAISSTRQPARSDSRKLRSPPIRRPSAPPKTILPILRYARPSQAGSDARSSMRVR